ncbi:MAG: NRAMP family divalent metal transporter [Planctomycetota bacterium]|jgi:Mn2+/Fe2+ NRAMP family transporter
MDGRQGALKALGPGFLFAAVSIGVSHLVQSTRAGAGHGLTLLVVIVVAMALKYPLFEFGHRYAAATGTSLLEGYRKQGKWTLVLYLALTLGTMFTVYASVTAVTAALAIQLTGIEWSLFTWSVLITAACALLIAVGRYPLLDAAIKLIMVLLAVSTIAALIAALPGIRPGRLWGPVGVADIAFIVGLVGWMPTGMDVSVWQSFWALARRRQTGHVPTLGQTLFDFKLGYVGTGIIAVMFCCLGAAVMYGSGIPIDPSAAGFARQLIELYTSTLGEWSRPIIGTAAFTALLSTTLTVIDGFPRALQLTGRRFVAPESEAEVATSAVRTRGFWIWTTVLIAGGLLIIRYWMSSLLSLVDLATILSFVTAPFLAILTYRAMTAADVPAEFQPGRGLRATAIVGIGFLLAFLGYFLFHRFIAG